MIEELNFDDGGCEERVSQNDVQVDGRRLEGGWARSIPRRDADYDRRLRCLQDEPLECGMGDHGHAASMPVEICMKLTPQCLDTAAYNKNKEREDFKKVSEVDTIQECEDAGVLALSLGTQIFHGNVPKSLRDVPQVIVGKIMLAKFSPGISLRFSRL